MRDLAVELDKGKQHEIRITQKEALETGWICCKSQGRKENKKMH